MDTSVAVNIAQLVFTISGTLLLTILGYLLVAQALIPACVGVVTSFRHELREEPLMALVSVLMLFFLISILTLAIGNPAALQKLLRGLVFA